MNFFSFVPLFEKKISKFSEAKFAWGVFVFMMSFFFLFSSRPTTNQQQRLQIPFFHHQKVYSEETFLDSKLCQAIMEIICSQKHNLYAEDSCLFSIFTRITFTCDSLQICLILPVAFSISYWGYIYTLLTCGSLRFFDIFGNVNWIFCYLISVSAGNFFEARKI